MQAEPRPKKLLDQVRGAVRSKHYSDRADLLPMPADFAIGLINHRDAHCHQASRI